MKDKTYNKRSLILLLNCLPVAFHNFKEISFVYLQFKRNLSLI